ncbi:unnamed protein product [Orchesella dallaii]|uniref:Uncharacterized protein n=1 Tax=Orchesella dallaii TaxID=48710 RepID=A0ABP1RMY4_9HEXA
MDTDESESVGVGSSSSPVLDSLSLQSTATDLIRPSTLTYLLDTQLNDNFNEEVNEGSSTEEMEDEEEEQQQVEEDEQQQQHDEEEEEENIQINPRDAETLKGLRRISLGVEASKNRNQEFELRRKELEKSFFDLSADQTATTKVLDQLNRQGKNFATQYRKVVVELNAVWSETNDRINMVEAEGIFSDDSTSPPISIECLPSGTTGCLENAASPNSEGIGINVPQIREKFCEMVKEFETCVVKGRNNKFEVGEMQKKKDNLEQELDKVNRKVQEMNQKWDHNLQPKIPDESHNQKVIEVQSELAKRCQSEEKLKELLLAKDKEILRLKRKLKGSNKSGQAPPKRAHYSKRANAAVPAKDTATVPTPFMDLEEEAQVMPAAGKAQVMPLAENPVEEEKIQCKTCNKKFTERTFRRHRLRCERNKQKQLAEDSECGGSKSVEMVKKTMLSKAMETLNQSRRKQEKE